MDVDDDELIALAQQEMAAGGAAQAEEPDWEALGRATQPQASQQQEEDGVDWGAVAATQGAADEADAALPPRASQRGEEQERWRRLADTQAPEEEARGAGLVCTGKHCRAAAAQRGRAARCVRTRHSAVVRTLSSRRCCTCRARCAPHVPLAVFFPPKLV